MNRIWHLSIAAASLLAALLPAACHTPGEPQPPGCDSGSILIMPTATRQTDPDLFSPPAPSDGGDGADYCPTPIPAETPAGEFPEQFVTTEVVNLSLDVVNQDLAATAVGDDMLAVAWFSDGDIYVALSRGGNHFQVRQTTNMAATVTLAWTYSPEGAILIGEEGPVTHLGCEGNATYDFSTGLIFKNGRYFDPNTGIWIATGGFLVWNGWQQTERNGRNKKEPKPQAHTPAARLVCGDGHTGRMWQWHASNDAVDANCNGLSYTDAHAFKYPHTWIAYEYTWRAKYAYRHAHKYTNDTVYKYTVASTNGSSTNTYKDLWRDPSALEFHISGNYFS